MQFKCWFFDDENAARAHVANLPNDWTQVVVTQVQSGNMATYTNGNWDQPQLPCGGGWVVFVMLP